MRKNGMKNIFRAVFWQRQGIYNRKSYEVIGMKKYICIMICLICSLWLAVVSAQQVKVSGFGMNYDEAERDALRNAVEQAVGTMVDSTTLVKNSELLSDEIYKSSKGYIRNYQIVNRQMHNDGTFEVNIYADVDTNPNSKLMNELTRLGIINRQLRDPKIAVIIPEYHIRAKVPDPAGETAIIRKLTEAGFSRIIYAEGMRNTIKKLDYLTAQDMHSIADNLNVDILIVGEAFSEGIGDVGKFIGRGKNTGILSCSARLEAKIFIAKTGQIISANGTYGKAADVTKLIASKKALNAAGEKMGDYIVEKLLNYGSTNTQNLEVKVITTDFNKVNMINKALQNIHGVSSAMVNSYNAGTAVINLKYSGTPQSIYNQLSQNVNCSLKLQQITYNTLTVTAY